MAIAVTYDHYGDPEVLQLAELPTPVPSAGQITIRVIAAGVNRIDLKLRRGDLATVFAPAFPMIPGFEAAGTVTAVGEGVADVAIGEEVFGVVASEFLGGPPLRNGGYASETVLAHWAKKPAQVDWNLAAGISIAGEAAFRTIGHLAMKAGETLLIHGAGGSVGSLATQLAVNNQVTVIGTASEADQDFVRSLGAIPVLYGDGWIDRARAVAPDGVDAVLDTSGAGVLPHSITLAGGPERVLTIADTAAFTLGVRFTGNDPTDRDRAALRKLADLLARDALSLRMENPRPLTTGAAAVHRDVEDGRLRHKVVLVP